MYRAPETVTQYVGNWASRVSHSFLETVGTSRLPDLIPLHLAHLTAWRSVLREKICLDTNAGQRAQIRADSSLEGRELTSGQTGRVAKYRASVAQFRPNIVLKDIEISGACAAMNQVSRASRFKPGN